MKIIPTLLNTSSVGTNQRHVFIKDLTNHAFGPETLLEQEAAEGGGVTSFLPHSPKAEAAGAFNVLLIDVEEPSERVSDQQRIILNGTMMGSMAGWNTDFSVVDPLNYAVQNFQGELSIENGYGTITTPNRNDLHVFEGQQNRIILQGRLFGKVQGANLQAQEIPVYPDAGYDRNKRVVFSGAVKVDGVFHGRILVLPPRLTVT